MDIDIEGRTSPEAERLSAMLSPEQRMARAQSQPWESARWTWWLIVGDLIASTLSVIVGLYLLAMVATTPLNQMGEYGKNVGHGLVFPLMAIIAMAVAGTYRSSQRSPNQSTFIVLKDFVLAISLAGVLSLLAISAAHHVLRVNRVPSLQILSIALTAIVFVPAERAFLRHLALRRRPERVLIVDSGVRKDRISTHVALQHGFELVGWVVTKQPVPNEAIGTLEQLPELVAAYDIDRVIIGSTDRLGEETVGVYRAVLPTAHISVVPRSFELISWRSRLTDLSGLPLLEIAPPLMTKWDRAVKRFVDLVLATVGLVITIPFSLLFAIIIKLTSPGPVFFRQARLGKDRAEFTIYKFRSMTEDVTVVDETPSSPPTAPGEVPLHVERQKTTTVQRVTPIGRFLRQSGLDEIPQFWNVIKGDMSMVGPRPFITKESEPLAGWSARRFEVRPGITGIWQVSGRNDLSAEELRQLDYLYVASWSMWWDLRIMFETPRTMIRGIGAY